MTTVLTGFVTATLVGCANGVILAAVIRWFGRH